MWSSFFPNSNIVEDCNFRKMVLLEICLVFLVSNHFSFVCSLNEEGLALLSFKNSLTSYAEGYLQNWNSSDGTPCSWNGIACTGEKVVSLSIAGKKLSGTLHPALGKLAALRHLSLRNNELFGSLPDELCNLAELQTLVMSGNSLSGTLPRQVGNLMSLQTLDLSQNYFTGSIPTSVHQCKRLEVFVLSRNNLTGSIPEGFGSQLTTLQNLNLSFNVIGGSIPADIGNLSNLYGTLDLSHNAFTGPIPPSLGSLPESLYIDLSYNNLSGPVPPQDVLLNIGPTAYKGNPFLCGLPLNISCPSAFPDSNSESLFRFPSHGKGGNCSSMIALAASIVVGFCLLSLLVFWYKRSNPRKGRENIGSCNFREALMVRTEFFCFAKFDIEPLPENMDKYSFVLLDQHVVFDLEQLLKASAYLLGKNGNGIVYKVILENGQTLAVRRLEDGAYQRFKEFQTEVEAIGKVRHPNIVTLLAYCWSVDEKLLIYEYIPQGDLATAIHGKAEVICFMPLSWSDRMKIMKRIAKGLAYLHEFSPRKYVHGDLKPSNILLGQNMEPYISDFGLGRLANIVGEFAASQSEPMTPQQNSPFRSSSICSTPSVGSPYQAPEALKAAKPSQKWDVYSFGVIFMEVISGKLPTTQMGSSEMELVQWIQLGFDEGKPASCILDPSLTENVDKEEAAAAIKIAVACTHKSPEKRPCMRFVSDCLEKLAAFNN